MLQEESIEVTTNGELKFKFNQQFQLLSRYLLYKLLATVEEFWLRLPQPTANAQLLRLKNSTGIKKLIKALEIHSFHSNYPCYSYFYFKYYIYLMSNKNVSMVHFNK